MPNGPVDAIRVDVPLFLRLLEFAREDAQTDMDLHTLTENILSALDSKEVLTMADYDTVVPRGKTSRTEVKASLRDYFESAGGRHTKSAPKTEYKGLSYLHRYLNEEDQSVVEDRMRGLLPKMNSKSVTQMDSLVPDTLDAPEHLPGVVKK